ncbi:hypothetical protein [Mammaliicoccus sp. N-M52]|uniref:hypothetical protein n=1 Tax=Mammaliicoccus sp. N-M52 TaxID=2898711 RepID=UPI001EFB7075|nr:hypothetical protein [Mammaliicoccus sp. N-M52]
MLKSVITLLQSNIETPILAKETGLSKGYITNLRNGNRDVSKASYEVVEKLFLYYLEKKDYIEASKDIDQAILNTKIPKDIKVFISSLKDSIEDINNPNSNKGIEQIRIERIFNISKENYSEYVVTYLSVNELIPLKLKNELISYNLSFSSEADSEEYLREKINDFTIIFSVNDLELELRKLIYNGAKVKLVKSNFYHNDNFSTGILVYTQQDEIYKYESKFLELCINNGPNKEEA